jgi:hypothetical protein
VDVAQAGPGDTVLVIDEGNGARQILGLDPGAVRAVIVGVVDEVTVGGVAQTRARLRSDSKKQQRDTIT